MDNSWIPPPIENDNALEYGKWIEKTHFYYEWDSKNESIYCCFNINPSEPNSYINMEKPVKLTP